MTTTAPIAGRQASQLTAGDIMLIENDRWTVRSVRTVLGYTTVVAEAAGGPGQASARCTLQLRASTALTVVAR